MKHKINYTHYLYPVQFICTYTPVRYKVLKRLPLITSLFYTVLVTKSQKCSDKS